MNISLCRVLLATFVVVTSFSTVAADNGCPFSPAECQELRADRREIRADRRELRGDRREIRQDSRELRSDVREYRQDRRQGASPQELRADRIWEGTSEIQRAVIGNHLRKRGPDAFQA